LAFLLIAKSVTDFFFIAKLFFRLLLKRNKMIAIVQDRHPHGCGCRAYMDGFTARPGQWLSFSFVLLVCLLFSAGTQADTSWQLQFSHSLEKLLQTKPKQLAELNEPAVVGFYAKGKYKPLWSDAKGPLNRAYDLLSVIIHADDEGLKPSDYYLEEIKKYWAAKDLDAAIHLDLLLSAALYRYSSHVYSSRFKPHELDVDWHIKNKALDVRSLFAAVARKESISQLLNALPPQHSAYQLLKKALQRYRDLEQQGGWQRLNKGPTLQAGVQHKQVKQLRQRLEITGDLLEGSLQNMDIFDHGLTEAVKHFQQRHGLTVDGNVGPETRRALNITVSARIGQIRINMERWRWMPRKLGKRYLMVNMTGFELYIMENGLPVLTMPVIIGKSYRSTPSFSGLISTMEYNPYWTIPTNMIVKDFIPRQINDPAFLTKKSIKLFRGWGENAREIDPLTVNWDKVDKDRFPYWMRQEPGPKNALGRAKFLFSNPYEIYLHGTPDRHLFDRVVRTFSSGCIRVKDPVRLAAYLLNDGSLQMEEEILANIHLATNQSVRLPIAVPIYLAYWTAWVDQHGSFNFRHDIYGRDARLDDVLDS
jgi:murein L,D-transpeptidase YcbB/YkuD